MIEIFSLSEKDKFIELVGEEYAKRLEGSQNFFIPLDEKTYFIIFNYFEEGQVIIFADKKKMVIGTDTEKIIEIAKTTGTFDDGIQQLHEFFLQFTVDDLEKLQDVEDRINLIEDSMMTNSKICNDIMDQIVSIRRTVLIMKRYYVQMEFMTDEIAAINPVFSYIDKKFDRLLDYVLHLQESVEQIREAYQSQIDIEQNNLMKIFTVVTTIFLPLTLIVGWYGMNLQMPEFKWNYGYPFVITVSLVIILGLVVVFKKKKWF